MADQPVILFAGGGTGGHVYPGLALADALTRLAPNVQIRWVGTEDRMEARAVPLAGYPIDFMKVSYLKGRRGLGLVKALASLPGAGVAALRLVRRHRPACVIGLGGFVSGPVCAAAKACGIPVFLLEQNAKPGMTNRNVSKFASAVYVSFEASRDYFPKPDRVFAFGNPVRRELLQGVTRTSHSGPVRLLVFGGSQGAASLNEELPRITAALRRDDVPVDVWHATGRGRDGTVREAYAALKLDVKVTQYIDDMAGAYSWADIILCRAGATTVAELTAVGLPGIYVPFPYAADDHQTVNAQAVVDAAGGEMITDADLRTDAPIELLKQILADGDRRELMASNALQLGRPDAALTIATDILGRISIVATAPDGSADGNVPDKAVQTAEGADEA